mgnify:CR=1 FL=1
MLALVILAAAALLPAGSVVVALPPKSLVLVVADGLGPEQLVKLPSAVRDDGDGRILAFDVEPYVAPGATYPESASAASALSTGCSVPSRWVSQVPSMTYPRTLGEMFANQGKPTGVVSTTCAVDATVAAMFVHARERHIYTEIGDLMSGAGLSVVLGGITHTMTRPSGACVVRDRHETTNGALCESGPLVSEYGELNKLYALECQYMPYAVDRDGSEVYPTLLEMTRRAVDELSAKSGDDGFFLMISADRIDHALHTGKRPNLDGELAELDAVIAYLRDLFKDSPDTMVAFTSDHATEFNSTRHSGSTVPGFIYTREAGRIGDVKGASIPQTSLRKLIFPTSRNACGAAMTGEFIVHHREYGVGLMLTTIGVLIAMYALIVAVITHVGLPRGRYPAVGVAYRSRHPRGHAK